MNEEARDIAYMLRKISTPNQMLSFPQHACKTVSVAADLIESLSEQLEQVTRERDAAVADILRECNKCKHFKVLFNGCTPDYDCPFSDVCMDYDHWQWRGVEVEG